MPYLKEVKGRPETTHREANSKRERQTALRLSHTSFLIMGTRSRIGIQLKDDSILSVYCHWDGYPSFNGRVLREFYNTPEKVVPD